MITSDQSYIEAECLRAVLRMLVSDSCRVITIDVAIHRICDSGAPSVFSVPITLTELQLLVDAPGFNQVQDLVDTINSLPDLSILGLSLALLHKEVLVAAGQKSGLKKLSIIIAL